ncbi:glycosyltransferase family 4 protein [Kineococcus sp. GCM10028916]|uniref:glycosyltransferase family 4 protein n=1 Tax=Kineococcus sp. GCM10028916 TaxID=3273394 RepID=UPI003628849E
MSVLTLPPALVRAARTLTSRVLLVADSYLPRLGGIELHVRDLATRLSEQGHAVTVVTATGALPDEVPGGPFRVIRLQPAGALGVVDPVLWSGAGRAELHELVAAADVVHAHSSVVSPLSWAALRAAHRLGVPAVVTVHSMLPRGSAVPLALALSSRRAGSLRWTAVSEAVAAPLRRATGAPVALLPNGIDPAPWRGLPRSSGSGPFTVVTAGRFAARKRVLPLLGALRDLRASLPRDLPLQAVLVGDGPQHRAARAFVQRHDMGDWVSLPGRRTRPELAELFATADVYVAPAVWESFGLAALEARCAGLAVAGMVGSGLSEFVTDGVEGALARDDRHLAEVLAGWALERGRVDAIRRHNATTDPRVTWARVLPATLAAYEAAGARPSLRA